MRDPSTRPRGRFQQYRRCNSLSALEPPTYEESQRASAQSITNVETPLPRYEEAMLRSSSLHDLLHADDPPRVPLPEIPADWNREGPSVESGRHASTSTSAAVDNCHKTCCFGCCFLFLVVVMYSVWMGLAFHFIQPRNTTAGWIIFSIMFYIPILTCLSPCFLPMKKNREEEEE